MKTTDHFLGDRVSVRCRRGLVPAAPSPSRARPGAGDDDVSWLGGTIIARDVMPRASRDGVTGPKVTRYVVQLDDHRRVVAYDEDVRRFTLAFEIYETLEKMAS